MNCSNCGKEIPNTVKFCSFCGAEQEHTKFCVHCGEKIDVDCVVCPKCGKQVEEIKQSTPQPAPVAPPPQIVIHNNNVNTNTNVNTNVATRVPHGRVKNKWVTFLLCLFLGYLGVHKFYEGKIGMGILYLCTGGLFMVGALIDLFVILGKPKYYY